MLLAALLLVDQPRAAMPADIQERVCGPVGVPRKQDRQSREIATQERPRFLQLARMYDRLRRSPKDLVALRPEALWIDVVRDGTGRDRLVEERGFLSVKAQDLFRQLDFRCPFHRIARSLTIW